MGRDIVAVALQFAEYFQGQSKDAYDAFLKRIK